MANGLTIARIVLSVSLPFLIPLKTAFFIVYAVCAATDMLDGVVARMTRTQSALGARLDSIADLVLAAAVVIALYPVIQLPKGAFIWIVVIIAVRFAAILVAMIRFKTFASLHTLGNKLTGFLCFLFPITLAFTSPAIPVYVLCVAASYTAAEELLIQFTAKTLNLNRKSIFSKEK